jgi:hypothetical protein
MNYSINKNIRELSLRIKTLKAHPFNKQDFVSQQLASNQYNWNIKGLIVELLFHSKIVQRLTPGQLNNFQNTFNKKHSKCINYKKLLDKYWISTVNGQIIISEQIRQTFYYFRQKDKNKPVFVTKNKDELFFLYQLYEKIGSVEDNMPELTKNVVLGLIKKHKSYYNECPDLDALTSIGILRKKQNNKFYVSSHGLSHAESYKDEIYSNLLHKALAIATDETKEAKICECIIKGINFYWSPNIINSLGHQRTDDFLKVLINLVKQEKEFVMESSSEQISKWFWNSSLRSDGNLQLIEIKTDTDICNESFPKLYNSMLNANTIHHDPLSYKGDTYYEYIDYLIQIIVTNDTFNEHSYENSFKNIKALINISKNRPYIFWKVIQVITRFKPEVLPYLVVEDELAPVILKVILEVELNTNTYALAEREEKKVLEIKDLADLWLNCFNVFLYNSVFKKESDNVLAEHIVEIFITILQKAFLVPVLIYHHDSLKKSNIYLDVYKKALRKLTQFKQTNVKISLKAYLPEFTNQ